MDHKSLIFTLGIICLLGTLSACNESIEYKPSQAEPVSCTTDVCKDQNILSKCDTNTGIAEDQTCLYGCDLSRNQCSDKPKCTTDVCKDQSVLSKCDTNSGIAKDQTCPYGCDLSKNQCNDEPKCTNDVCKDQNILSKCDTNSGIAKDQTCPYGCDLSRNQCNDEPKCNADKCKDDNVLLVCDIDSGDYTEKPCSNGCREDTCVIPDPCVPGCKSDNEATICLEDGSSDTEICPHGCDSTAGKCKDNPIIGKPCQTEEAPMCEGNALIYCAESLGSAVWTRMVCPEKYACKEYEDQKMCLEACTNQNDTNTICGSGFLVGSICSQLDGGLYYTPDYDTGILKSCENGCKDHHSCADE